MNRLVKGTLLVLMMSMPLAAQPPSDLKPPQAKKEAHPTTYHGYSLPDDYFWMRHKDQPQVLEHLKAEQAYTDQVMEFTKPLQEQLYQEFLGRIQEDDSTPPFRWRDHYYYSKTVKGLQYRIYMRYPADSQQPEQDAQVVLDLNEMAKGHSFMSLSDYEISDNGQWLAYSFDETGYRQYKLAVKNLKTGEVFPQVQERVTSLAWLPDNRTLLYTTEDAVTKRSDKCWLWTMGGEPKLVFEDKDELFDVGCYRSRQGNMLFIKSSAKTSSEVRYAVITSEVASMQWKLFEKRELGHEYDLDFRDGQFYMRTNRGATNFQVLTASLNSPDQRQVLIGHQIQTKIERIELFANFLVLEARENAYPELLVYDLSKGQPKVGNRRSIPCPDPIHSIHVGTNLDFETDRLRFGYESPVTPSSVYECEIASNRLHLLKQTEVKGYRKDGYRCQKLEIPARDGTKIPVSLVYSDKVDLSQGPHPFLLYGYGSYGVSIDPNFNSNRVSWLDRGVVFAIAHIRGGGELGEPWRNQGRMEKKMTTFHDFADVAAGLCQQGLSTPQKIVAQGGSAGGLLMGVVANQRPELFAGMVAQVPFVDVMNTMLDASLPLTTGEYIEWGNPNEKSAFETMRSYSPYDNVHDQKYPSMLVEVSLNDSQVPYWEGAKWVAKLREHNLSLQSQNPILLKTNFGAGHGGASGRYDALREQAFRYAYVLWRLGLVSQNSDK